MTTPDYIKDLLRRLPFVPFTVGTTSGDRFHIPTGDHAHVLPRGSLLMVWPDDGGQIAIPVRQIEQIAEGDPAT